MKTVKSFPDNAYRLPPDDYFFSDAEKQGRTVRFTYKTKDRAGSGDTEYDKYALVYLPAGYDDDTVTRYNVLYIMHGGSDSPEWFLKGEGMQSRFSRMFDNLIERGEMQPMIICFVSYYTEYCDNAEINCKNFHLELMNDIIPVFEKKYRTFAENVTPEGIRASRRHRGFGGFSMGAVTTWSVFEHRLDSFAWYLPISGDCWAMGVKAGGSLPKETAEHLAGAVKAGGFTPEDLCIYTGAGGTDVARPNLEPQAAEMARLTDVFVQCDNFADGNFYYLLNERGGHDKRNVLDIMFNGLPKMFDR